MGDFFSNSKMYITEIFFNVLNVRISAICKFYLIRSLLYATGKKFPIKLSSVVEVYIRNANSGIEATRLRRRGSRRATILQLGNRYTQRDRYRKLNQKFASVGRIMHNYTR